MYLKPIIIYRGHYRQNPLSKWVNIQITTESRVNIETTESGVNKSTTERGHNRKKWQIG